MAPRNHISDVVSQWIFFFRPRDLWFTRLYSFRMDYSEPLWLLHPSNSFMFFIHAGRLVLPLGATKTGR